MRGRNFFHRGDRPAKGGRRFKHGFCKSRPTGLAGRREVEGPAQARLAWTSQKILDHDDYAVCDVERKGRCAALVVDHRNFIARFGEPQHGLEKIHAEWAINPARAQDDVVFRVLAHRGFAGLFRFTVSAERRDRVVFDVASVLQTVKYVVCRDMDQRDSKLVRSLSNSASARAVDGEGELWFFLGT